MYQFREGEARSLWKLLGFGEGRLAEMRCIDMEPNCPKDKKCKARSVTTRIEDFLSWAREWNGKGNCFIGRNPRNPAESTKVKEIAAITLDLDPIRDKPLATPEQTEECVKAGRKILGYFRSGLGGNHAALCVGSLAISGNGCLLVWTTSDHVFVDKTFELKLKQFQDECQKLISEFPGVRIDATQDNARLIKLIGTVSVKGGIRATRFLHLAGSRGDGDSLFRYVASLGSGKPVNQKELLAKSNYDSRSEADYGLASFLYKRGFKRADVLAALAKNPLGRNDRPDDHIRICDKLEREMADKGISANGDNHPSNDDVVLHAPECSLDELLKKLQANKHGERELPTGFNKLDTATNGLRRGEIYTVGARTSVGKSSFLLNCCVNLGRQGKRSLVLSTEMSELQIKCRMVAIGAQVPESRIAANYASDLAAISKFIVSPGYQNTKICDSFEPEIEAVEEAVKKDRPDVLIFDHIQHISFSSKQSEVAKISEFVKGLKRLAMHYNCAVLMASQLKRPMKAMDYKTRSIIESPPSLTDLKGCGTIEEESAQVLVLHYDEAKYLNAEVKPITAELLKNRYGPKLITELEFNSPLTTFKEKG